MRGHCGWLKKLQIGISCIVALLFSSGRAVADTAVHLIGVYEGPSAGPGPTVHVKRTAEPITLVLSSYESLSWLIYLEEGAMVEQVIVNGYEPQYATIRFLETLDEADVPVHYFVDEKVCFPGDSRSDEDPVSLGVYPARKKAKILERFFDALESNTDLVVDRENSVVKAQYTSRLRYVVSNDSIKGRERTR
jgi:hypothetical protein